MKKIIALALMAFSVIASAGSESSNWEGFYGGGQIGYGWGQQTYQYTPLNDQVNFTSHGMAGGLTGGYNWQTGNVVYGGEIDFSWSSISGSVTTESNTPCYIEGCNSNIKNFGTARARVGYDFHNVMPYITGGIAFTRANGTADEGACGYIGSCQFNSTLWGPTVGAGVEWLATNSWSIKAEYIYFPLSTNGITFPKNSAAPNQVTSSQFSYGVARMGINYHF